MRSRHSISSRATSTRALNEIFPSAEVLGGGLIHGEEDGLGRYTPVGREDARVGVETSPHPWLLKK